MSAKKSGKALSYAEKAKIIEEASQAGSNKSKVAEKHGIAVSSIYSLFLETKKMCYILWIVEFNWDIKYIAFIRNEKNLVIIENLDIVEK